MVYLWRILTIFYTFMIDRLPKLNFLFCELLQFWVGICFLLLCSWFCWVCSKKLYVVAQLLWSECVKVCELYIEIISHMSRCMKCWRNTTPVCICDVIRCVCVYVCLCGFKLKSHVYCSVFRHIAAVVVSKCIADNGCNKRVRYIERVSWLLYCHVIHSLTSFLWLSIHCIG